MSLTPVQLESVLKRLAPYSSAVVTLDEYNSFVAEVRALQAKLEAAKKLVKGWPHEFVGGSGGRFTADGPLDPDHTEKDCKHCQLARVLGEG